MTPFTRLHKDQLFRNLIFLYPVLSEQDMEAGGENKNDNQCCTHIYVESVNYKANEKGMKNMKKMNFVKKMICMAMVMSMVLGLNLSANAAGTDSTSVFMGSLSGSGSQTGFLSDWFHKYPGIWGESSNYAAPANVTVKSSMSESSRTMLFSWDVVEGADKYILQLSTTEDFTGDDVKNKTTKSSSYKFVMQGGINGVYYYPAHRTYYFRVKAVFGNYEGPWSSVIVSHGDAR